MYKVEAIPFGGDIRGVQGLLDDMLSDGFKLVAIDNSWYIFFKESD
jgi:hypothetical protein